VLAGIHPASFTLLLVLYRQVFRHLRLSLAIPAASALSMSVVWREVLESGRPLWESQGAIVDGLISVVFGSLFAIWITRIIEQLETTRSELAAAARGSSNADTAQFISEATVKTHLLHLRQAGRGRPHRRRGRRPGARHHHPPPPRSLGAI
jgi:hypothetical protein